MPSAYRRVVVRFTDATVGDFHVTLDQQDDDTVRSLKSKIRSHRSSLSRRRLRVIHAGHVLPDGTRLISYFDSLDARRGTGFSQVVLPSVRKGKQKAVADPAHQEEEVVQSDVTGPSCVYLQCSVGDDIETTAVDGDGGIEEQDEQLNTLPNATESPRGFDRFQSLLRLESSEIDALREEFHRSNNIDAQRSGDFLREDEEAEHARALEEQWIEELDGDRQADRPGISRYRATLHGLMTGFFLPFIPFFYFTPRAHPSAFSASSWPVRSQDNEDNLHRPHQLWRSPGSVFSPTMQTAIVLGIFANVVFGSFRGIW